MTDTRDNIPSVVARTRAVVAEGAVVGVHFLKETAAFVLGEEALLLASREGEPRRVAVHGGGILSSAGDGSRIVTGGDDGKVVATDAKGELTVVATDPKHRWIDHVAVGPGGAIAWSAGKQAFACSGKGGEKSLEIAFDRRRARLRTQGLSPRDRALQRRHALVPECQGRAGGARLEGLASRRDLSALMAVSSLPRCRSRRCTAGGSPTIRTCACRATRRAYARSTGPPTARRSRPQARPSS